MRRVKDITSPVRAYTEKPSDELLKRIKNNIDSFQEHNQINDQTMNQSDDQSDDQSKDTLNQVNATSGQFSDQSLDHLGNQSNDHITDQSIDQLKGQSRATIVMTDKMFAIYLCLRKLEGLAVNANILAKILRIPVATVHNIIMELKRKLIITGSNRVRIGKFSGSIHTLNSNLIATHLDFTDERSQIARDIHPQKLTFEQIDQVEGQSIDQSPDYINNQSTKENTRSSLLLKEKTTTAAIAGEIETELALPVHQFWVEHGLSTRMVVNWTEELKMPTEIIFRSMEHCRWAIEKNGKQVTSSPIDLLYGSLKKFGNYTKPKGFVSYIEQQRNLAEEIQKEKEQQLQELRDINLRREHIELDMMFENMMSDPESELYLKCFEGIPPTLRRQPDIIRIQPEVFRDHMLKSFKNILQKTVM